MSNYTKTALSKMDIPTASWPPLRPDLDIIENICALLKKAVRMHQPKSLSTLKKAIEMEWAKIVTNNLYRRLFSSINRRIRRVALHGLLTKY